MYQILKKNIDKTKYLIALGIVVTLFLLVTVVYKSDEKIVKKSENDQISSGISDLISFKKFLLNRINSPFINLNYEIKKGDTIQKILKKLKVDNSEIQKVINHYKKHSNPNQLLVKNTIDIIVSEFL